MVSTQTINRLSLRIEQLAEQLGRVERPACSRCFWTSARAMKSFTLSRKRGGEIGGYVAKIKTGLS